MEPQLQRPADYRVLARAYRPTRLSALIGQEALVRTLKNAFASGRVAHAFLLSGIRGVGKTTTARIIARGLNCTGPDGQGGPTPEPCGVCASCTAIDEDRALDVIEMDAASQTGKDDVLELLEGLQFLPSYSRYKVYILDEVHMLSPKAWNALLKTVEEPPPHAKFIFATTEVRKVPITVLSRCQKFELRRVEPEELAAHLAGICAKEGVTVAPDALAMVARAAEGSVRDALSLLDQAIATAEGPVDGRAGPVDAGPGRPAAAARPVRHGDARRRQGRAGAVRPALRAGRRSGGRGAGPARDRPLAVAAQGGGRGDLQPGHRRRRRRACCRHGQGAVAAGAGARLADAAARHRRDPGRPRRPRCRRDAALAHRLRQRPALARPSWRGCCAAATAPNRSHCRRAPAPSPAPAPGQWRQVAAMAQPIAAQPAVVPPLVAAAPSDEPADFAEFVARLRDGGEAPLAAWLSQSAHLIRFEPGRVELRFDAGVPTDVAGRVGEAAIRVLGRRWMVIVGGDAGEATLAEQAAAAQAGAHGRDRAGPGTAGGAGGLPGRHSGRHPAAQRLGATDRS